MSEYEGARLIGGNEYIITTPVRYNWTQGAIEQCITVPIGLHTDFASIPGWWWVKKLGFDRYDPKLRRGSEVHDFLYMNKRKFLSKEFPGSYQFNNSGVWQDVIAKWKRKEADKMLRKIIIEDGFPVDKANVVYRAVRIFGGIHSKDPFW